MNQGTIKCMKYISKEERLNNANDIDKLSEKCFPLCMNLIHRHINTYSHLMNFGRLQFTLFLKGTGLPV